ncbi:DUF6228 family protein [Nocardia paucivorans]|uniref:DUF6228 family protein n=1 Tax=Nocardia paucivorans TaxID=114259 RepID=UPI000593253A|nr:DUF6228 family protein [Nocardia paucivorans]
MSVTFWYVGLRDGDRIGRHRSRAQLRIHGYDRHDEYTGAYAVEITAEALAAAFVITTSDGDGLDRFVRDLADDFADWDDERSRRSMDNDSEPTAAHQSGGKA